MGTQRLQRVPWLWPQKHNDLNVSISVLSEPEKDFFKDGISFDEIVEQADAVVEKSFGTRLEGADSTREHLLNVDCVSMVYDCRTIMGFASVKIYPEHDLLYLHGVVVHPDLKGMGVGRELIKAIIDETKTRWLVFTTQNPIMYLMLRSLCRDDVFPSPEYPVSPLFTRSIVKELVEGRVGEFNEESFVIKGLYKKCLYERIPRITNSKIQDWFDRSFDHKDDSTSNDGFIFFGRIG